MKFLPAVLLCLAWFAGPTSAHLRKMYILPNSDNETEPDERRVWIKFKDGQRSAALESINSFKARSMPPVKFHFDFTSVGAMVVSATVDEINELSRDPSIEEIVDDPKRYPMHIPESMEPRVLQSDGETIPYGIKMVQATQAHQAGYTGVGAKVCVVDTGIDRDHEDFQTFKLSGLVTGDPDLDWTSDAVGHGTHCSGTIAAAKNGIGVVGVAPDAEIYTVRVFDGDGRFAYGSSILSAVQECAGAGFNIVSMSLGGPLPNIFEWFSYRNLLNNDGILSIAAAGNSGNSMSSFPASYPGVISVAAIDENMEVADFSQKNRNVDIAAPGVNVLSTFPTNGCSICDRLDVVKYGVISGTSMATPHVAGVAALLRGAFPDVSATRIAEVLLDTALPLGEDDYDRAYGNGLVQALAALELLSGESLPQNPAPSPTPPPPVTTPGKCDGNQLSVEVSLFTDSAGDETYWWITRDSDNYPVALGTLLESATLYDYSYCLPSSCYTFSLFDSSGDGIQAPGSFSVTVDGEVIADSDPFESEISYRFGTCASGNSQPESEPEPEPSCAVVAATVLTDQYPSETTVKLVNTRDNTVLWKKSFDNQDTLYDDMTACVDRDECFVFTIEDSHGDGLCCLWGAGYVTLSYDGETIISKEEEFEYSIQQEIGDCS